MPMFGPSITEYQEMMSKVDSLTIENAALKAELAQLSHNNGSTSASQIAESLSNWLRSRSKDQLISVDREYIEGAIRQLRTCR